MVAPAAVSDELAACMPAGNPFEVVVESENADTLFGWLADELLRDVEKAIERKNAQGEPRL